jgi:hypothetical protein
MNKHPLSFRPAAFAAAALALALAGCASTPADDSLLSATPPFAAGWQAQARPLYYSGPGVAPGTTAWMVPMTLPRGTYEVIQRRGDRARVVDGHRFEIDGSIQKEIKLMVPIGTNDLEALDVKYIASAAPAKK